MSDSPIVGRSTSMTGLRRYLGRLAGCDASVFIVGETGTGKECVARFVHGHSARSAGALVCVNCSAIPDGLLESELFGYERGAFTGAASAFPGQLRRAHGGTLFLDELADMTLAGQAKLLRVLENRQVVPLGGRREVPLDIRVIAAASVPPEQLVASNRLRPDLYYRLNVARVDLPPLRDRREDIVELFDFFMRKFLRDQAPPRLTDDAIACLLSHDWPGNVRELRNIVERILIEAPGEALDAGRLRQVLRVEGPGAGGSDALAERAAILRALLETRWNKRRAAQTLNWSRMTLYRKMAKYHIVRSGQ